MKTAVIDVGGGLRGIFAAGVLDGCIDADIRFDMAIGVSAGSANLASYLAHQKGRNFIFYTEYALRKKYMGLGNFILRGSYINLDYVYSTLSNSDGENPLDYPTLASSSARFIVVATNALTGEVKYFEKSDISKDNYDVFKASCAIPFVCRPYTIGGVPYYDGALSDPIPIKKAFEEGCDRVVLILTKPRATIRTPQKDMKLAKFIRKKYPYAAKGLEYRAERYNQRIELAKKYEKEGKLLIIAPYDTCGVDTLTRNRIAMQNLYAQGQSCGEKIISFLNER